MRRQIGLRPSNIDIEIFQAKLQLIVVEALGAPSEAAALEQLDDLPQPVDLGLCFRSLAVERRGQIADHPMQRIDVVRQGAEIDLHEPESKPAHAPGRALSGR